MSTGSISTYRNKKRACCQSRTASSILYTISTPKWREDIDISVTLLKRLYGIYQRLTGHMDITLHGCRYVPKAVEEPWATYSVRWLWLRRYDGNHGTACTKISCKPISETLQFPYLCYPAISIPLQKFRRLERRKTGKNAPKNYSCHRDFASRAVADRRRYTAQEAAASPAR